MGFGNLHLILRRDALCLQHQVNKLQCYCFNQLFTWQCLLFKGSEGLSRDGEIAVASSVTVFTVASILFFIVGFLCGHFCQKKRKSSTAAGETVTPAGSEGSAGLTQTPYYDDVVLQQREPDLELKENVAYGPISI
jgi:hypothetical protein